MNDIAQAKPVRKVDCSNEAAVVKEAVAYSLLGAWKSFTTHDCFKGETFKYFKPELGKPEGELLDPSQLIWFDKTRDSYRITGIRREGVNRLIDVEFKVSGRPLKTTYVYQPNESYAKKTGICGFVLNGQDSIYRADCALPGVRKELKSR